MQEYAEKFYKSKEWKECRIAFIKSLPDKTCNRCKEQPGKIVHHNKIQITPENINNPYITLNFDNLEYICQDCHTKEHLGKANTREGLYFDEDGNLKEKIKSPPTIA